MTKPKRPLPFSQPTARKLMPDLNAGDTVVRASIEAADPGFDVVLRRGEEIKHIFFRWEPSEQRWAGVVGTVVPLASAEALHRQLNDLVDAAVAEGWEIREDNRCR